ncbi:UBC-like protein [Fimicolochytrium jonesii]|uniref:UBC-like protein n=1 Tax=Fimicolochytrium jonesii TaxID=1396493 RepID=UPI0022FDB7AC|nr:UBC-like protein [Fimicolochytrium jonesii]KAI8821352.1 UBC-like protein [Fimicolochytrium jonesii]
MASKAALKRLTKEYAVLQKDPVPYIVAKPLENNILEWHYVIRGPPGSPYAGGEYHGKVLFPADYPFSPPDIKMLTPNGRFQTDYKLCLSMTTYHRNTWNPAWSVATILTGLLSFMVEDASTTGSIKTTLEEKKLHAVRSHAINLRNPRFREVFPELCTPELAPLPNAPPTTTPTTPAAPSTPVPSPSTGGLHQRNTPATSPASATSATPIATTPNTKKKTSETQQPREGAMARRAGAVGVVGTVWQNVRSNVWRILLMAVLVYLVVLKIVDRIAEGGADSS